MPVPIERDFATRVAASGPVVWEVASTMAGVNAELAPLVRMTFPEDRASLARHDLVAGEVVFRSWLLGFGVVPFDRHALALERVIDGRGFDEESSSWMQQRWRHERRIVDHGDGTATVTDHLVVVPRIAISRSIVAAMIGVVFRHRHRRLAARFGAA